ncbi:hypothetical protein F0310_04270 (plasmid) [Borrelia sp. A-FGy1]|uniref:hypothetical protein n=1 Tax=Borrelia sp. A-FGy1 TaxID=2608247 RepID=UPI0015F53FD7|nr:hypothetical protein [Borrelia sp. A-FGy1]QMU99633.1 hypothetical protein F0310_04270 [Borrelia sp. A-FGy1]
MQKHLKQYSDFDSNVKPTSLSPELKQKLFDVDIGVHILELNAILDKLIEKNKTLYYLQ